MEVPLTCASRLISGNFFQLDGVGKQHLAQAWYSLMLYYTVKQEAGEKVFTDLLRRYDARGRYYHNSSHLAALLNWYERYQGKLRAPEVVQFAIWFHDVIYRTRRHDNEWRSAELAINTLTSLGIPRAVNEDMAQLIRATQTHRLDALPEDLRHDGGWFLDFDLAILGSRSDVYAAYAKAIQREYAWVPGFLFRQKRRAVLENFLQRPHLYFTESMRAELETQARANLTKELAELR